MAKLTCYGGAGSATGANFLLEIGGNPSTSLGARRILVDCGMMQGIRADEHNRRNFEYDPASIDYLFVTHAHIDHTGLIPKLVKNGFKGEIYSTQATKEIATLLLIDAAKIGREEERELYTIEDVEVATRLWRSLKYHEPKDFGGFTMGLYDAGHVLGSAMVKFTGRAGKTMLFSGDIGNSPSLLLPDVEKVSGLDYLLIESVYGDRNHENRQERAERFKQVVKASIERGGTLLIPAFSLERTQTVLSLLDDLFESKKIPSVPVYLDSPLAIKLTLIYERIKGLTDNFDFKELIKTTRVQDSKNIASVPGAKVIIAGSGMSTGGRILHHEKLFLPDPNSTVLFMGYQAAGTLGRQIEEGAKKVLINDEPVEIKAKVEKIEGFSGHADSDALVKFVEPNADTLKKVFVAMGEPKSSIFLTQRLRDEFGIEAVTTEKGKTYQIDL